MFSLGFLLPSSGGKQSRKFHDYFPVNGSLRRYCGQSQDDVHSALLFKRGSLTSWGRWLTEEPRCSRPQEPDEPFPRVRSRHRCCRRLGNSCPSCLPLHGHLGELVSPVAAPRPPLSLPHSWDHGGGADIRGKGGKAHRRNLPHRLPDLLQV